MFSKDKNPTVIKNKAPALRKTKVPTLREITFHQTSIFQSLINNSDVNVFYVGSWSKKMQAPASMDGNYGDWLANWEREKTI